MGYLYRTDLDVASVCGLDSFGTQNHKERYKRRKRLCAVLNVDANPLAINEMG